MVIRPNIMKILKNKVDLPPPPPLFNKEILIEKINSRLLEENTGNISLKIKDIKNPRRTWISYEYHLDITYNIGTDPKDITLMPNGFYDNNSYEIPFEDQLFNRLALIQRSHNRGE